MNLQKSIQALVGLVAFTSPLFAVPPTPPSWWIQRGVTNGQSVDDYAVANQGQLKQIATQAAAELDVVLAPLGGAGSSIDALIVAWSQPPGGVPREDYAALNQGQLKTVAKLYYDRFAEFGYWPSMVSSGQIYPWTNSVTDDESYATANIGQLKFLFSFDLAATLTPSEDFDRDGLSNAYELFIGTRMLNRDTDRDGIPDAWELRYGLNPSWAGDALLDRNSDLISNLDEFLASSDLDGGNNTPVGLVIFSPEW